MTILPTPAKPYAILKNEKKSHRTKAELELRKKGEEELTTGIEMKARTEVKKNKIAYKEFKRINKLLKNINKNDSLYESVLNRYSMLYSECKEFEEKREVFYKNIIKLEENFTELTDEAGEMTLKEYFNTQTNLENLLISIDKQIQSKRKMMLDIEKENVMTIASSLRSIPKKENQNKKDPLLKILSGGG